MLRIRFQRVGLKRQPTYRIVVTDSRNARSSGRVVENLGYHNPRTRPATDIIDSARALYWLSVGAQPSDAAKRVIERTGGWGLFERLRKGESLEALSQEAATMDAQRPAVSPKTRYPSPEPGQGRKARAAAAEAAQNAE